MKFKENSLPVNLKDRLKYLYRFQEMLRLFHNVKGTAFRNGKMSEVEFRQFQKGWFGERNQLLCQEINKCKAAIPEIVEDYKLAVEKQKDVIDTYKAAKHDEKIHVNITDIEE